MTRPIGSQRARGAVRIPAQWIGIALVALMLIGSGAALVLSTHTAERSWQAFLRQYRPVQTVTSTPTPVLPALSTGDCALVGPNLRADPQMTPDSSGGFPMGAIWSVCLHDGYVVVSTTQRRGCNQGLITVPDGMSSRIDCLAFYDASVGQCADLVGPANVPVPELEDSCGGPDAVFAPAAKVLAIVPSGKTGVYGCPNSDNAYYIGLSLSNVACLSVPAAWTPH